MDSCSIASGRDGWRGGICCTSLRSYFTCCTGYCPASSQPPVPPHTCRVRLCLRQSLIAFFFVVFTALFFRSAANARRPELTSPLPGPAPARMILMSNSAVRCSPRRNETKPRGDALRRANAKKHSPSHVIICLPPAWGYQPSGGPPADSAYAPIGNPWPTRLAPLDQT